MGYAARGCKQRREFMIQSKIDDNARKQQAALASIAASALLALGKLAAGLLSGSLALLSEAGHGLLDTAATILTWFAVRESGKPADEEHHYGHGKMEAIAALAETGMLLALAFFVLIEAIKHLFAPQPVEATWLVFAVLGVSVLVDAFRWRALAKIARETRSDALAADALHFSSDLVASVFVALGLLATRMGYPQGDALAAVAVALFIGTAGLRLARRTVDTLTDAAPAGLAAQVRGIVAGDPGVQGVEAIRLRPAGSEVIGEVIVGVSRTLPLERVAAIKSRVGQAISAAHPETHVTITANPVTLDDETVLERVLLVSALRRLPVHHVTVQEIDGVKSVSLDLEIDGRMKLGVAHDIASKLEAAIEAEVGGGVEVETHIEPMEVRELDGHDAGAVLRGEVAATLARHAAAGAVVADVHNVRVRATAAGLVVNYHCRVDPALSVKDVHAAVDAVDRAAQADHAGIVRIVGHAEPARG